jgi:ferric-dicitrate binding protein FerR (iron transport regulator)
VDPQEHSNRQKSALNDLDAISKRHKRGEITAEEANDQTLAVMQALERDTAGYTEEMKRYWAKRRLKMILIALAPIVVVCGAIVIWLLYK